MFQKLRFDLTLKLADIKLLLINAEGFTVNGNDRERSLASNGNRINELKESEVECIAFSESTSSEISTVAESLGVMLHQGVSEKARFYSKIKEEYSVGDSEVAFICRDNTDIPIIRKVSFSAVARDAHLDVKKESYYAAYGVGQAAVAEIAALIIKAKNYPGGWSE